MQGAQDPEFYDMIRSYYEAAMIMGLTWNEAHWVLMVHAQLGGCVGDRAQDALRYARMLTS